METIAGVKSTGEAAPPHPLSSLVSSWRRHLAAVGKARKTTVIYTSAAVAFGRDPGGLRTTSGKPPPQHDRRPRMANEAINRLLRRAHGRGRWTVDENRVSPGGRWLRAEVDTVSCWDRPRDW